MGLCQNEEFKGIAVDKPPDGEHDVDPMMTVLREGGPFHTRGMLPNYLKRLRATGRAHYAQRMERLHPDEI